MQNFTCTFADFWRLYNPNPYQDRDPSHHSMKFPHVCFQAILTHAPRVYHYCNILMFLHVDFLVLKPHENEIVSLLIDLYKASLTQHKVFEGHSFAWWINSIFPFIVKWLSVLWPFSHIRYQYDWSCYQSFCTSFFWDIYFHVPWVNI